MLFQAPVEQVKVVYFYERVEINIEIILWDVTNTGNGERGTGNGKRGTGNGEPGTGVWEQVYSGNPLENSKWRSKQKKRLEEKQFGAWLKVSFHRLCLQMASMFL